MMVSKAFHVLLLSLSVFAFPVPEIAKDAADGPLGAVFKPLGKLSDSVAKTLIAPFGDAKPAADVRATKPTADADLAKAGEVDALVAPKAADVAPKAAPADVPAAKAAAVPAIEKPAAAEPAAKAAVTIPAAT